MTTFRRLEVPACGSPYDRSSRCLLRSFALAREEFARVQSESPGLMVEDGGALLVLQPFAEEHRLHYAFPDRDSFRLLFAPLLDRALEAADRRAYPGDIYLYYRDHPNRPFVEPVLRGCAFELMEEWMEMTLAGAPETKPRFPRGFAIRPCSEADLPQVIEVNEEAFGPGLSSLEAARRYVAEADAFQVVESRTQGRVVGFLRLLAQGLATGLIDDIAVRPAYQRRGLGEAMMRWALAWCRDRGLPRAKLEVRLGNAPALALYRKLGFAPGPTGLTYRRPIDDEQVRRILEGQRGTYIKFGGWR